jgi:hypothetical protein
MFCFKGGKSSGGPVPRGCQRASGKSPEERQDTGDDGVGRRGIEPFVDLHGSICIAILCMQVWGFLVLLQRWGQWGQSAISNSSGG